MGAKNAIVLYPHVLSMWSRGLGESLNSISSKWKSEEELPRRCTPRP